MTFPDPQLSRWLAAVVNAPRYEEGYRYAERERFVEAGSRYTSLAELPDDLRALGDAALREQA